MDFEYGCATTNKFSFLDENEVEDPSDLLAQVTKEATPAPTKGGKAAAGKDAKAGGKPGAKTPAAAAGAKDAKKQPLQQQADNKSKAGLEDAKKDG